MALHGHLPGWRAEAGVEIVAAADPRPSRKDAFLSQLPSARWYSSAEELLQSEAELDFVDVCTPPGTHADVVWLALQRGLHVLCEKPLVISPEELPGLIELAGEKDRVLHTVHNWRHAPMLAAIGDAVRRKRLGEIRKVSWTTLRTQPAATSGSADNWRLDPAQAGAGVLMDHGWHALYVLHDWLGVPQWIAASLSTRKHMDTGLEDTADVYLQYESDATAQVYLTWAADERSNRVEVVGADGVLVGEGRTLTVTRGNREECWGFPASLSDGSHHPDWFGGVVRCFLGEIAGELPRENLAEASLCVKLLALAQVSSRTGGDWVAVDSADTGALDETTAC